MNLPPAPTNALTKKTWKLTEPQKLQIIDWVAQGLGPNLVVDEFENTYGFTINYQLVCQIRTVKKWSEELEKRRVHYRSRLDLLDNSHKYVRVKRMDEVFNRAIAKGDLSTAISATEQARKEFEKESETSNIYINNPVYNQLNVLSNEELKLRHDEAVRKMKEKIAKQETLNGPSGTPE